MVLWFLLNTHVFQQNLQSDFLGQLRNWTIIMASEGTCILNSQWTLEKYESESVSCSVVSDSATPCTVARQALLSMEFSRQEYWSGLPFPSPGVLPNLASNLGLLHGRQVLQFFFNLFYFILFVCVCVCVLFIFYLSIYFYFTILYWFCHTLT